MGLMSIQEGQGHADEPGDEREISQGRRPDNGEESEEPETAKREHGAKGASMGMEAVRIGLEVEELSNSFDDCNARASDASATVPDSRLALPQGGGNKQEFLVTTAK